MDWLNLTPDERRDLVVKERDIAHESYRRARPAMLIMTVPFTAVSLFIMIVSIVGHSALVSSLGFILGSTLGAIGALVIWNYRIKSFPAILSDDFSDSDAIAYLREKDDVDRRFLRQLSQPVGFLASLYVGLALVLMGFYRPPDFAIITLATTLGFLCLSAVIIVQRQWAGWKGKKRANTGSRQQRLRR